MRATRITRWAAVAAVVTAPALHAQGTPPAQPAASQAAPAAAPTQPPSVCGNTAYCAETNDFAAVITNFRTSDLRGYKMIDVVMHFVNKTSKPLVLGYVQNSGTIIDDKGNRYIVWGANGVRGIGQVYGGSFDPKFSVDAGSSGDAQFELAWYPGTQIYGFNFAFDLAIDEINSYEGGQHSLGSEFPLHFQGLANGISSSGQVAMGGAGGASASGAGAGGQPCNNGAAGTATAVANATGSEAVQGAAQQGASTVAQATTAVQSVASLFSKKKSQPKPAANPCGSASGTVTQSAAGSVAPSAAAAGGASPAPAGNATTATAPAKATTSTDPAAMKAGVVRAGTTPPVTPPTTKTPPTTTTTTTTPTTHNPAPKNGNKKTVTPDTTTKHP